MKGNYQAQKTFYQITSQKCPNNVIIFAGWKIYETLALPLLKVILRLENAFRVTRLRKET